MLQLHVHASTVALFPRTLQRRPSARAAQALEDRRDVEPDTKVLRVATRARVASTAGYITLDLQIQYSSSEAQNRVQTDSPFPTVERVLRLGAKPRATHRHAQP